MGDSDDEYEKKIRDKFRGERDRADSYKGIDNRREERRPPRDDWMERLVVFFHVKLFVTNFYVKFCSEMLGIRDLVAEEISETWCEKGIARYDMIQDHLWSGCEAIGMNFSVVPWFENVHRISFFIIVQGGQTFLWYSAELFLSSLVISWNSSTY